MGSRPALRRTWAPRGHTPRVVHQVLGSPVTAVNMLCYSPVDGRTRMRWRFKRSWWNTTAMIEALGELGRYLHHAPVIIIWDNLSAHRSSAMRKFLTGQRWVKGMYYLPAYAPDLNPTEGSWANLKGRELANLITANAEDILAAAQRGLTRIRRNHSLHLGFIAHTGLTL